MTHPDGILEGAPNLDRKILDEYIKEYAQNRPFPKFLKGVLPGLVLAKLEEVLNWGRGWSVWYFLFALACCGIELMQAGGPRTDLDRFGSLFRSTPRQSDLMIVAGTVTYKMAPRVKLLYEQMAEPRYVIAMGSCANCGGPFVNSYSVVKGIDLVVPVDLYLPGCPPRPESLAGGILELQKRIKKEAYLR